jgi:hypothetical protein
MRPGLHGKLPTGRQSSRISRPGALPGKRVVSSAAIGFAGAHSSQIVRMHRIAGIAPAMAANRRRGPLPPDPVETRTVAVSLSLVDAPEESFVPG